MGSDGLTRCTSSSRMIPARHPFVLRGRDWFKRMRKRAHAPDRGETDRPPSPWFFTPRSAFGANREFLLPPSAGQFHTTPNECTGECSAVWWAWKLRPAARIRFKRWTSRLLMQSQVTCGSTWIWPWIGSRSTLTSLSFSNIVSTWPFCFILKVSPMNYNSLLAVDFPSLLWQSSNRQTFTIESRRNWQWQQLAGLVPATWHRRSVAASRRKRRTTRWRHIHRICLGKTDFPARSSFRRPRWRRSAAHLIFSGQAV